MMDIEYFRDRSHAECQAAINVLSRAAEYDGTERMITALEVLLGVRNNENIPVVDARHPNVVKAIQIFESRRQ